MPDRRGPYRNMRFLLEIDGIAKAGFARCRLPSSTTDVIEYREGTDPPTPRKLSGLKRFGALVLSSGVTTDSIELFEWRTLVEQGKTDAARRSIAVVLLGEEGDPGPRYELQHCWPRRYESPQLDARGECVAIEVLEIVTEGVERVA
ncbi:MAG: phage tail protein [Salinirussus sp.]